MQQRDMPGVVAGPQRGDQQGWEWALVNWGAKLTLEAVKGGEAAVGDVHAAAQGSCRGEDMRAEAWRVRLG